MVHPLKGLDKVRIEKSKNNDEDGDEKEEDETRQFGVQTMNTEQALLLVFPRLSRPLKRTNGEKKETHSIF